MQRAAVEAAPGMAIERKHVLPPAIVASRMQRYAVYLMVCAFLLLAANYRAVSVESVLWFGAGLAAGFALMCAVAVTILHAVAWNFDRLREELRGGRAVVDMR